MKSQEGEKVVELCCAVYSSMLLMAVVNDDN